MKRRRFIHFLCLMAFLLLPLQVHAADVISILYFENTTKNNEYDWFHKGLADMLITDVSKSKQVQVVERENLEKLIREQKLSLSGLTDESQAIKVGKLLNAKKLIYGSYIILQNTVRVDTKITEVETGKIIHALDVSGKLDDIFSIEKELAEKILRRLDFKVPDDLSVPDTNSLDALISYYKGIALLDDGKADKAIENFQRAKDLDPQYLKPQKGLEEAYQFLKDYKKAKQQREIIELYNKIDKLKTSCDKRGWCVYELMVTLFDIGHKSETYFKDTETKKRLCEEVSNVAEKSKEKFKSDPAFPYILHKELDAFECLKDYKKLKDYAEIFLKKYPNYPSISFVENLYERTLDHLKEETWDYSESINERCGIVTLNIRGWKDWKWGGQFKAGFVITAPDKKQYSVEKNSESGKFTEVLFPYEFKNEKLEVLAPQSGRYLWECIVGEKTVAKGGFEYKIPSSGNGSKNLKTKAGELTIEKIRSYEGENTNYIKLNGETVHTDDLNDNLCFEKLFKTKDADVVLLSEDITREYRFITLSADESYQISGSFGSYGGMPETKQHGDKIIIKFPKTSETVTYENMQVMVKEEEK